jgi:hypothetical protein
LFSLSLNQIRRDNARSAAKVKDVLTSAMLFFPEVAISAPSGKTLDAN